MALPESTEELWSGSPLLWRRREGPLTVRLGPEERNAVYALALDCLAGIAGPCGESLGTVETPVGDDVRQILVDLGDSGSGSVVIQIGRIDDPMRLFKLLAERSARGTGLEAEIAHRACVRLVGILEGGDSLE
jgi:hypothetical protein